MLAVHLQDRLRSYQVKYDSAIACWHAKITIYSVSYLLFLHQEHSAWHVQSASESSIFAGSKLKPIRLEEESRLCKYYQGKMQQVCKALTFPDKVAAAALLFFKRFYLTFSSLDHDPKNIMLTCIYLACKVFHHAQCLSYCHQQYDSTSGCLPFFGCTSPRKQRSSPSLDTCILQQDVHHACCSCLVPSAVA